MMHLNEGHFEGFVNGMRTKLFILENAKGVSCAITNYGGRVVACSVPDFNDRMADVVLGFDHISGYIADDNNYFGAIVGRVANRTAGAAFYLGEERIVLDANDGKHHIHGGLEGFHKQVWTADQEGKSRLRLGYLSEHGESRYPGEIRLEVTYTLTDQNELDVRYKGWSDRLTPLNLTNHTYFNLNGAGTGTILKHDCRIFADFYHPINSELIPTGKSAAVEDSPFDFRKSRSIGQYIDADDLQLKRARGYDHNFILNSRPLSAFVASVTDPVSGRRIDLATDRPGLQFYSGNFLDGSQVGKNGARYAYRTGFCLEAQDFPNSLNEKSFPPILVGPDTPYSAFCTYKFGLI